MEPRKRKVKKAKNGLPEVQGQDISIKVTTKEETADQPEVQEKLPIDKLVDIATEKGLLAPELTQEQRFEKFIKGIQLHDIIYDCMQSSLNEYCKIYNERNPGDNIQFKLHTRKRTNKNTTVIFAVSLVLEMRRGGLYKVLLEKRIDFTHVKQIRDEVSWKYSLYGAMYNDLITHSLNHLILQDDVKSGRIKSEVSSGPDRGN